MKKGSGRTYLAIYESYRDENKAVKKRLIKTIGYLDEFTDLYDDPIAHFKNVAKEMTAKQKEDASLSFNIDFNASIDEGCNLFNVGYLPYKYIFNEVGLNNFFIDKQKRTNFQYSLNKNIELLLFSRILYPGSKKSAFENKDKFFAPFDTGITRDSIYNCLDYLFKYKQDILNLLWKNTQERYNRDSSKSYYDCTNYYFEIEYNDEDIFDGDGNIIEKGMRKRGPEKNHRPDPIVEMGLLMDSNGIPMAYDIFPGNESEKTSLRPLLKKTKAKFGIERTIVVADRGLNTSDNIYYLAGVNNEKHNMDGYVYGQSIRGASDEFKKWAIDSEGFKSDLIKKDENDEGIAFIHKSRIASKTIQIERNGKRDVKVNVCQKQMVYFSFKYMMKQRKDRNAMIEKAKKMIANPANYTRATSYGAANYINNLEFDKKTGEIKTEKVLSLDVDKIAEEAKYDGYYSIVTSETEMDDYEMRNVYRGLAKIEDTFKVSKTNFGARPVFVWTREHIEGHFLICFIALVIMRLLEKRLDNRYPVSKIIKSTKNYNCISIDKNIYQFIYRDEIIDTIAEEFNVDLNKKYVKRNNIRNLLKY